MYRDLTIAVVVPAYNEEGFVGRVIDDIPAFVDRVYVIDDGSTDGTWSEINDHATQRNESHDGIFEELVVPIQHEQNRGVGGAIKTGYEHARREGIEATAVLGGDDQMNPAELERYIDPIAEGTAEYVKGNRFSRPEHWEEMPRFRLFGNVVLSYLTKVASGYWELMDSQNGYTVISLTALQKTDIDGMYEYYGYCNDLLVRLNAADVTVADVPRPSEYAYSEGWKSHIDYREYIPRVSGMLARSFLWRLRRKYLLTEYHVLAPLYAIGISGTLSGIIGLLNALFRRSESTANWLIVCVLGLLTTLTAAELDRKENESLQVPAAELAEQNETGDAQPTTGAESTPGKQVGANAQQTEPRTQQNAVSEGS